MITLLVVTLEDPLSSSVRLDLDAMGSFRHFLEKMVREEYDLHSSLKACVQMEKLAQNAVSEAQAMLQAERQGIGAADSAPGLYDELLSSQARQQPTPVGEDNDPQAVMTPASTPKKHSLRTYKDLPDMSTEHEPGKIVTIYVGYTSCGFQVHRGKLGPLAKLLDDPSNGLAGFISLPNERAETFNALVNWIYNEPLPRAAKTTEYNDDTKKPDPIPTNKKTSIDLTWENQPLVEGKTEKPNASNAQLEDAHATQCLLLDLMMLAERYSWEELYNAAIDAFREGEANLERERPDLLHIGIVYQRTTAESPIRQFLGDYAYALARSHQNLTWYLQEKWFDKIPEFLEDMLKRVDGKGPFEYPFKHGAGKDTKNSKDGDEGVTFEHEAPLDLSATTYHIHGGSIVLACRRSEDGGCIVE
ncbi:hypothetical protein GQX73_g9996 [Xylaria multiplex]|uniref:BTB domain-containing protein n=1 Tax=Xylaria multiplex TaxID=323545 RepID=A0A7C8N0J9_9PEZI|nr:hypothetical protein GQX73_g9996 [Xylaria multiplex]